MKNNVYPCKPQFYYIKVGFKGVKIISACFRDDSGIVAMASIMAKYLQQRNCLGTVGRKILLELFLFVN